MSPIGGVGINLALQDAIAAANILAEPLRRKRVGLDDLRRVQKRRNFPTWATQKMQVAIQNNVIDPMLASGKTPQVPRVHAAGAALDVAAADSGADHRHGRAAGACAYEDVIRRPCVIASDAKQSPAMRRLLRRASHASQMTPATQLATNITEIGASLKMPAAVSPK